MPNIVLVPLQVYGYGFIISMFIAVLIKVMMYLITKTSRGETDDTKQD